MKKEFLGLKKKNFIFLITSFLVGIIFLYFGEYSGFEKTKGEEVFDESAYTTELEGELASILEEMNGVDNVKVMITLSGGKNYRYANKTQKSQSGEATSLETNLQMQEGSDGKSQPILTQTLFPEIRGVSVVCKGAADPKTQRKIIGLVASTLDLNENQIFVTE
jgi:stage III sporulation protein AG